MNILGVIAAKGNSKRFPDKNIADYKGKPLFWHNVEVLKDCGMTVFVVTDSDFIKNYCEKRGVKVIWRGENINKDEQPIFQVLKFAHNSLPKYDIMVNILANTIDIKKKDVQKAIDLLIKHKLHEVRSYNNGVESGLMVFKSEVFTKHEVSIYVGAVNNNSKEIHYESEIKNS